MDALTLWKYSFRPDGRFMATEVPALAAKDGSRYDIREQGRKRRSVSADDIGKPIRGSTYFVYFIERDDETAKAAIRKSMFGHIEELEDEIQATVIRMSDLDAAELKVI